MKDTCSVSEMGRNPAAIIRQAEQRGAMTVCRNGRVVGVLLSRDRMEAILETIQIQADPEAMKAIRQYEAGHTKMRDVSCLDDK